mmetsp:Transcript_71627/g.142154  ORF Transcript_71627/g.142154 Transcript_71627/m.142154 type:complete len:282 (+) Transcript_71627:3-848(+)
MDNMHLHTFVASGMQCHVCSNLDQLLCGRGMLCTTTRPEPRSSWRQPLTRSVEIPRPTTSATVRQWRPTLLVSQKPQLAVVKPQLLSSEEQDIVALLRFSSEEHVSGIIVSVSSSSPSPSSAFIRRSNFWTWIMMPLTGCSMPCAKIIWASSTLLMTTKPRPEGRKRDETAEAHRPVAEADFTRECATRTRSTTPYQEKCSCSTVGEAKPSRLIFRTIRTLPESTLSNDRRCMRSVSGCPPAMPFEATVFARPDCRRPATAFMLDAPVLCQVRSSMDCPKA